MNERVVRSRPDDAPNGHRSAIAALVAIGVLATMLGGSVLWFVNGRPEAADPAEPVRVVATGPRFDSIDDLVVASDLVVAGEVVAVDGGRAITDPSDPTAGIRTQLVTIAIEAIVKVPLVDGVGQRLVIEQEGKLLDGTPLIVNGLGAFQVGDRGVVFLIHGDGDAFPYTALINEQGWARTVEGRLLPTATDDPVWGPLAGTSEQDLVALLLQ